MGCHKRLPAGLPRIPQGEMAGEESLGGVVICLIIVLVKIMRNQRVNLRSEWVVNAQDGVENSQSGDSGKANADLPPLAESGDGSLHANVVLSCLTHSKDYGIEQINDISKLKIFQESLCLRILSRFSVNTYPDAASVSRRHGVLVVNHI